MAYHTVFIDTNLDTHLALIVSDSETVSDLKKKLLREHALTFPEIGPIKITALKVKRRGYFYHLSDSMLVKSAFDGVYKSWFVSVDASLAEAEKHGNDQCQERRGSDKQVAFVNVANNGPANADGLSKCLPNAVDAGLADDESNQHVEVRVVDRCEGGGSDKLKDSSKFMSPNTKDVPRPREECNQNGKEIGLGLKAIGGHTYFENETRDGKSSLPMEEASENGSLSKRQSKRKKRKDKVVHDVGLKASNDSCSQREIAVPEISLGNVGGVVSSGMQRKNQKIAGESVMSLSSDVNKRFDTMERGANVADVPLEDTERSVKRRRKVEKGKGYEDLQMEKSGKRKSKKDKSNFIQEISTAPVEAPLRNNPTVETNLRDLGGEPNESDIAKQHVQGLKITKTSTVIPEENHGELAQNLDKRPSLQDAASVKTKKARHSKDRSIVGVEGHPCPVIQESCRVEAEVGVSKHKNPISNDRPKPRNERADKVEDKRELSQSVSLNTMSAEKPIESSSDRIEMKIKEVIAEFPVSSETADSEKSSRKKMSKRTQKSVSKTPIIKEVVVSSELPVASETHRSVVGVEEHPYPVLQESCRVEEEVGVSEHENAISNDPPKTGNERAGKLEDERELLQSVSLNTMSAKKPKESSSDRIEMKTKEAVPELLVASETAHPEKLSHLRKTSKKARGSISETLVTKEAVVTSELQPRNDQANRIEGERELSQSIGPNTILAEKPKEVSSDRIMMKSKEILAELPVASETVHPEMSSHEKKQSKKARESISKTPVTKDAVVTSELQPRNEQADRVEGERELSQSISHNTILAEKPKEVSSDRITMKSEVKLAELPVATETVHPEKSSHEKKKSKKARESISKTQVTKEAAVTSELASETVDPRKSSEQKEVSNRTKGSMNRTPVTEEVVGTFDLRVASSTANPGKFSQERKKSKLDKFISHGEEAGRTKAVTPHAKDDANTETSTASSSNPRVSKNKTIQNEVSNLRQLREEHNIVGDRIPSAIDPWEFVDSSQKYKSMRGTSSTIAKDDIHPASPDQDRLDNSDSSTRISSDNSSTEYSDEESNEDSYGIGRKEGGGKSMRTPIPSGLSLDAVVRGSRSYKKALLTASQSQPEDSES